MLIIQYAIQVIDIIHIDMILPIRKTEKFIALVHNVTDKPPKEVVNVINTRGILLLNIGM